MEDNFFKKYFSYTHETEAPRFYHRWCAISGLAAFLGRDYFFSHGHFTVNPNMYIMLIGSPGTRKSTAIKIMRSLLVSSGYTKLSADKTSKEKFLLDLHEQIEDGTDGVDTFLDSNLWGDKKDGSYYENCAPAELYIAADEFNDFIGNGNIEFISLLGTLWDYSGVFTNKIKTGKSVSIPNPTISILGGNTPTGFSLAFPPEILGQGFFSRLLLIYGEPTGKKITFPEPPCPHLHSELVAHLRQMKVTCNGGVSMSTSAKYLLDKIYRGWPGLEDVRFESYSNRRFTHLLKLCIVHSAARLSREVSETDVLTANTILTHTEHLMPKALGEFGKSRYSDVTHKIMMILDKATSPVPPKDIVTALHSEVDNVQVLVELLRGLHTADKIMIVSGGYLAKRKLMREQDTDTFNLELLSAEERNY